MAKSKQEFLHDSIRLVLSSILVFATVCRCGSREIAEMQRPRAEKRFRRAFICNLTYQVHVSRNAIHAGPTNLDSPAAGADGLPGDSRVHIGQPDKLLPGPDACTETP